VHSWVQSQHVQRYAIIIRGPFLVDYVVSGEELEAFLARHRPDFDRVIYVGDGKNDYCPVLRLRRYVQ